MIDRLLRRGIISKDFVASVMMIDLENPVLSADRESLWQFIPEKFSLTPVKNWRKSSGRRRRNKRSKNQGIAAIQAANVSADSAPGKWLQILQRGNSVTQLRNKITDYLKKAQTDLDENAPTRPQELKRLFDMRRDGGNRFATVSLVGSGESQFSCHSQLSRVRSYVFSSETVCEQLSQRRNS